MLLGLDLEPERAQRKEKVTVMLPEELAAALRLYQQSLGAATTLNYVIVGGLRRFLERDKQFQKLRAQAAAGPAKDSPVFPAAAAAAGGKE
jgi:hypothetical protein